MAWREFTHPNGRGLAALTGFGLGFSCILSVCLLLLAPTTSPFAVYFFLLVLFHMSEYLLTAAFRLFALLSYTQRRLVPLADPRLASPPTAIAVLERSEGGKEAGGAAAAHADDTDEGGLSPPLPRCPDVLLATASRTILVVDEHDQLAGGQGGESVIDGGKVRHVHDRLTGWDGRDARRTSRARQPRG